MSHLQPLSSSSPLLPHHLQLTPLYHLREWGEGINAVKYAKYSKYAKYVKNAYYANYGKYANYAKYAKYATYAKFTTRQDLSCHVFFY